jgi:hypothetical protein
VAIIKFRDGWTGPGSQTANWMQGEGERAIARRVRGDVVVERNGDFTNVYQGGQALDGYYSLGLIDGVYKVVGSVTARGKFSKRGDAGTATFEQVPALAFFGKGKGIVPLITNAGFSVNFDGKNCLAAHVEWSTTRDGKKMTAHYDYYFYAALGQAGARTKLHNGYWWNAGGTRTFAVGYSGMFIDAGGQHQPFFIYEANGVRTYGATLYLANQIAIDPRVVAMGPGNFLMLHRYYRPQYTGSVVDVGSCPGLFRSYSVDGGQTWAFTDSGDLFDDFDSVNALVPTDYHYGDTYNQAVDLADIQAVMLTGRMAFAVATVPYCVMVGDVPTIKVKVKYGLCDTAMNFLLASTGTIYDGELAGAPSVQIVCVDGGALMVTIPADGGDWATHGQIQFTPDGVSFDTINTMPMPAYQTGVIRAFDKKAIVCPMFDGEHSLYESKDRGLTWVKRATIYEGAPAPTPGSVVLQRFGVVTMLRKDDLPTNQTPATPWATDSKLPAPP